MRFPLAGHGARENEEREAGGEDEGGMREEIMEEAFPFDDYEPDRPDLDDDFDMLLEDIVYAREYNEMMEESNGNRKNSTSQVQQEAKPNRNENQNPSLISEKQPYSGFEAFPNRTNDDIFNPKGFYQPKKHMYMDEFDPYEDELAYSRGQYEIPEECDPRHHHENAKGGKCKHNENSKPLRTAQDEIFSLNGERGNHLPAGFFDKKPVCTCTKSKCLKLYCVCFRAGEVCGPLCKCTSCENTTESASKAVESRKKKQKDDPSDTCCNCKFSFCEKSYCVCARSGKGCGKNCKCFNCKNPIGAKERGLQSK